MAKAIYNGVDNVARQVKKPYIGVENVSRKVTNGYIGVDNVARECFSSGVSWGKYSCAKYGGYYSDEVSYSNTSQLTFGTFGSFGSYSGYYFDEYDGYVGTDYVDISCQSIDEAQALVGTYYEVYSPFLRRIVSVENVWYEYPFTQVTVIYEEIWNTYIEPEYSKGSTSYGTITAPEGELPEEGTLIEGSVNEGYCVLQIGSTYYYYVLEG